VPLTLLFYAITAVPLALFAIIFVKLLEFCKTSVFSPEVFPRWLRPCIGGFFVGLLAMYFPFVLGSGYGYLQGALLNQYTVSFLLTMALLKILATALTLGSGNAGGLFAPSLVIGGLLGAVAGNIGYSMGFIDDPAPVVIVGMAGFFGAVAKTPISIIIMVSEMTLGYGMLVPLMTVTALTYVLVPRSVGITSSQVNSRKDSPAHRSDYIIDVLQNLRVSDIMRANDLPPTVRRHTTLDELNMLYTRTSHQTIPVLDDDDELDGVLLLEDLREHLLLLELGSVVVAADLARHDIELINPADDASTALGRLIASGVEELPVVSEGRPTRIVGAISRSDIINVYHRQMAMLGRTDANDPATGTMAGLVSAESSTPRR
jgi:CIC family chloride channel protein